MRRLFRVVVATVLFSLAHVACAQTALFVAPEHCVFRAGDDARWAAPDLDESGWRAASQWSEDASLESHFWLRCQVDPAKVTPAVKPVLQISADASYEVFISGQLVASFGSVSTGAHTVGVVNQYQSSEIAGPKPFTLAVRITYSPTLYGQQPLPWILLGDANLLRDKYSAHVLEAVRSRWIIWLCNGIMAVAGLFFLVLYLFDRSQRVLLWAALTWLLLALIRFDEFLVAASVHIPSRVEYLLYSLGNSEAIFYVAFFFALARRPISRFFRVLMLINAVDCAAIIVSAMLPLRLSIAWRYWLDASPAVNSFLMPVDTLLSFAPLAAFWPINKLPRSQLALYCVCSFWMGTDVLYLGAQIPWLNLPSYFFLSFQTVRSVSIAAVVIALTLILIQRIRQNNRERAALATEMRAAQEIQRILVPREMDTAPQIRAEAVFLPAQQVGGDFYRCRVLADGSQWLLLGDVSGKGTAAGMTGAMLLGASERHEHEAPAEMLSHLNQVLCASGVGGLATCLCVRIATDGTFTIANAGHLPPYRNGQDMEVESGLPLGVAPSAQYDETEIRLEPSDVLMFMSDGVVESQNATGELFGFERARAMATQSVQQMAEAAKSFGQQDDITVLSIAFEPAEALTPRT
ncbi:PP2C family protein-serine/threonine phosphatase [Occallatibacter riparius]|uniref:Serine/threonine-protein phosphatase n=1 Tax=Occallatibacter riparius TaxID=1002689 RepID=A0A9J7BUP8_9BACT|nr:PP2C family protein-serine/threonine phosphatase [Occallatibacter riparius]UWZ86352.1 serine/threonine-protein phosphatase [Occallatibacter riparius]